MRHAEAASMNLHSCIEHAHWTFGLLFPLLTFPNSLKILHDFHNFEMIINHFIPLAGLAFRNLGGSRLISSIYLRYRILNSDLGFIFSYMQNSFFRLQTLKQRHKEKTGNDEVPPTTMCPDVVVK